MNNIFYVDRGAQTTRKLVLDDVRVVWTGDGTRMLFPHWLKGYYPNLNYQEYSYYAAPSCDSCDNNYNS
ncbi:MAG: hypothetical protein ACTS8Y_02970 [Arsenophonus sp. ER-EMS1-MAG3]